MRNDHAPLHRTAWATFASLAVLLGACGSDDDPEAVDATTSTVPAETTTTADAPAGPPGPIVFKRLEEGKAEGREAIYTVSADGSGARLLFQGPAEGPRWSPDGTEISVFCCNDGMAGHFVDVATGELRTIPQPDPALQVFCGGGWSPDGERVLCGVFGVDDPSVNGLYSIRASDGGDLTRITSNPGGEDRGGGYSPDGSQIVFVRVVEEGAPPVGMFVINVDGSGMREITPTDMHLDEDGFAGQWSPDGSQILVVGLSDADRKTIFVVDVAGGDPVPLPITPECGGSRDEPGTFGCYSPTWSPDGTKIIFVRSEYTSETTFSESIYMVNADGSDLVQVTDGQDDQPQWGTPAGG